MLYNDDEVLWLRVVNLTVGLVVWLKLVYLYVLWTPWVRLYFVSWDLSSLPVYLEQVRLLCCRYTHSVLVSLLLVCCFPRIGLKSSTTFTAIFFLWMVSIWSTRLYMPWLVTKCGRPSLPILLKWINHFSFAFIYYSIYWRNVYAFRVSSLSYCLIWYIPWHFLKYLYTLLEIFFIFLVQVLLPSLCKLCLSPYLSF